MTNLYLPEALSPGDALIERADDAISAIQDMKGTVEFIKAQARQAALREAAVVCQAYAAEAIKHGETVHESAGKYCRNAILNLLDLK